MHTIGIVFIYDSLLHVSAIHVAIFREAIQRIKSLKLKQLLMWQNQFAISTGSDRNHKILCVCHYSMDGNTDFSCSDAPPQRVYWDVNNTVNRLTPNRTNTTNSGNSRQCISTAYRVACCVGLHETPVLPSIQQRHTCRTPYLTHLKLWLLSLSVDVLDWLWHFKNGTILKLFIYCIASLKMVKWVAETCRRLLYVQIFH